MREKVPGLRAHEAVAEEGQLGLAVALDPGAIGCVVGCGCGGGVGRIWGLQLDEEMVEDASSFGLGWGSRRRR